MVFQSVTNTQISDRRDREIVAWFLREGFRHIRDNDSSARLLQGPGAAILWKTAPKTELA
jgi:hypothetical protein